MEILIKTTYDLEGDRLEILLAHTRIEALRAYGRNVRDHLTNVDAILSRATKPQLGTRVKKLFRMDTPARKKKKKKVEKWWTGYVTEVTNAGKFKVYFPDEDWKALYNEYYTEELTEAAVKGIMDPPMLTAAEAEAEKTHMVEVCEKAFDYLEQRLTGECSANYNCEHFYEVCRLVQVFDPGLAVEVGCDVEWVALMHATIKGFSEHIDLSSLIAQLPA